MLLIPSSGSFQSSVSYHSPASTSGIYRSFEQCVPIIESIIEKKRAQWTFKASLHTDFNDFKWKTIAHINNKWETFDQSRPVENWVARIAHNLFINELRDLYMGTASPCKHCPCAQGDDLCSVFAKQENRECALYSAWYDSNKRHKHAARMTRPMDECIGTVSEMPDHNFDLESAAAELHIKIKPHLTNSEYEIYDKLYIQGMDKHSAAAELGFKSSEGRTPGYQRFRKVIQKIIKVAKKVIIEEGLDSQFI